MVGRRALGQFEIDALRWNVVPMQHLFQHGQELRIGQVGRGDVYVDMKVRMGSQEATEFGNNLSQHDACELADKTQLLGGGDKDIGPDVLAVFVGPAGERFGAQDLSGLHFYDWLVDNCNQVAPQGAPQLDSERSLARL